MLNILFCIISNISFYIIYITWSFLYIIYVIWGFYIVNFAFCFLYYYVQPVYWVSNSNDLTLHFQKSHFFLKSVCSFFCCMFILIIVSFYFIHSYSIVLIWFQNLWSSWGSLNLVFLISRSLDTIVSFLSCCVYLQYITSHRALCLFTHLYCLLGWEYLLGNVYVITLLSPTHRCLIPTRIL